MTRRVAFVLALFALGACDVLQNPGAPSTPDTVVNYTALGASDAIGWGGSSFCIPLTDCPTGTGYVQLMERRLRASGKTVSLYNLGIPGAVLSPEVMALAASIGHDVPANFLDREVPFILKNTTLLTLFAGGNDVNIVGSAIKAGRAGTDIQAYINAQVAAFGADLKKAITGIRSRAPNTTIIALNLPNMGALPYADGNTVEERKVMQQIAVGFSAQTNKLTSDGVMVLDLMCDAAFYTGALLSPDGFHPNDAGYVHLADMVQAAFTAGSAPAPKASCSQMTVY